MACGDAHAPPGGAEPNILKLHKQQKHNILHILHVVHTFFGYSFVPCRSRELTEHEDERIKAENWFPVAWMPIHDPDKANGQLRAMKVIQQG